MAAGYLQRGEIAKALSAADRGLGILRETGIVWGNYIYGASGVGVQKSISPAGQANSREDYRDKALLASKSAVRATRNSPVCRPRSLLLSGRAAFLYPESRREPAGCGRRSSPRRRNSVCTGSGASRCSRSAARRKLMIRAVTRPFHAPRNVEGMGAAPDLAAARLALSSCRTVEGP